MYETSHVLRAVGRTDRWSEQNVLGEREGKGRKARASGAPRPPLPLLLPLRGAFPCAALLLIAFRPRLLPSRLAGFLYLGAGWEGVVICC